MIDWLKAKFYPEGRVTKGAKWTLAITLIVLLVWGIRACNNGHGNGKTVYRIGRTTTWYPLQLLGREKNLYAFTNDLLAIIGEDNGLRFEWVQTNPQSLVDGLVDENYDFMLTSLRPTSINEEHYDFSNLLYSLGPVLIVRQESEATDVPALAGKSVGVPSGLPTELDVLAKTGADKYDVSLVYFDNMNRALEELDRDRIDGVIMQALPAYTVTHGLYAGKLKVVSPPLVDEGLRLASLKKSKEKHVIEKINASFDKMRKNGTYEALIAKWGLIDAETDYWHPPKGEAAP